jgi:hypothetical protein
MRHEVAGGDKYFLSQMSKTEVAVVPSGPRALGSGSGVGRLVYT